MDSSVFERQSGVEFLPAMSATVHADQVVGVHWSWLDHVTRESVHVSFSIQIEVVTEPCLLGKSSSSDQIRPISQLQTPYGSERKRTSSKSPLETSAILNNRSTFPYLTRKTRSSVISRPLNSIEYLPSPPSGSIPAD